MPKMPSLTGKAPRRAPEAPQRPVPPLTWMTVLEDKQVPRAGGSYMLRGGKEINSANYDFDVLRRAGVKLQLLENPPQWWLDAQAEGERRGRELAEAQGYEPEYAEHPGA